MKCCIRDCKREGKVKLFINPFTKLRCEHPVCEKHKDNKMGYNFIYDGQEAVLG